MTIAPKAPGPEAVDPTALALARREQARAICNAEPEASFENVWHALILLELPPLDRLNRSLTRGRAAALQGALRARRGLAQRAGPARPRVAR